jgi:hypothetical protein
MRSLLNCAGILAIVGFVVGITLTCFDRTLGLADRLEISLMVGGIAFGAALLLGARDLNKYRMAMKATKKMLGDRAEIPEAEFACTFAETESVLVLQIRNAIAKFFNVPAEKIHPTDDFRNTYHFKVFEPGICFFIVHEIFSVRKIHPRPFTFESQQITDIQSLAAEIRRILKTSSS